MHTLENDYLRVNIRKLGAKVCSVISKREGTEREILYQPKNDPAELKPQRGDEYDERHAWGADICIPSVSACCYRGDGMDLKVSDHGNFWTEEFSVKSSNPNLISMTAKVESIVLTIEVILKGSSIIRRYILSNNAKGRLPFIFADHFLLPINENIAPSEYLDFGKIRDFVLEYSYGGKLGKKGSKISWPIQRTSPYADKLFAKIQKDAKGFYSVAYSNAGYRVVLSSKELPYVGYWHTEGGWKGEYNLGLELTNASSDNLEEAIDRGQAWWVGPRQSSQFSITTDIAW
ncbi:MAG: hypothetical protein PHS44_06430 [Candidatus Dojkabacteria bacterium]|nr:hypothetical protein [Candidatus Dojkabacteria bacterium]